MWRWSAPRHAPGRQTGLVRELGRSIEEGAELALFPEETEVLWQTVVEVLSVSGCQRLVLHCGVVNR